VIQIHGLAFRPLPPNFNPHEEALIMTSPFDQLTGLAKANLNLSLRLVEIACRNNQDHLQAAARAIGPLTETTQSGTILQNKAIALSKKTSSLFGEVTTIHERMIADTWEAIEKWHEEWTAAVAISGGANATELFNRLILFWQGAGVNGLLSSNRV
jgi:hypothetical protein